MTANLAFSSNIDPSNQFNLSLNGYEGPIDLLLDLAKKQKVNLSNISILELAEQYLDFIQNFKKLHLEIAADYLVMASWLTYLKSYLLIPKKEDENEHSSEELEAALKYQLQRLDAMQKVTKILYKKPLIGRDVFYSRITKGLKIKYSISYSSSLYDLLKTYASIISKNEISSLTISQSDLYSVEQSIQRLKKIFGFIQEWTNFMNIIPEFKKDIIINKSAVSSNFVASLELAKNGFIEVSQKGTFSNIYVRVKQL